MSKTKGCINPGVDPQTGAFRPCLKCKSCRGYRIAMWKGRLLLEQASAKWFDRWDMTYRPLSNGSDPFAAKQLRYSHVQRMLYRIRKYQRVRYFVVGEYGSTLGRAHWHMLIWGFYGKSPMHDLPIRTEKVSHDVWPHGFTFRIKPDVKDIQYVSKYILKEAKPGSHQYQHERMRCSLKPPLGAQQIRSIARRHALNGEVLPEPRYELDIPVEFGIKSGMPVTYPMGKTMRREYLDEYYQTRNGPPRDLPQWIENYWDKVEGVKLDTLRERGRQEGPRWR